MTLANKNLVKELAEPIRKALIRDIKNDTSKGADRDNQIADAEMIVTTCSIIAVKVLDALDAVISLGKAADAKRGA